MSTDEFVTIGEPGYAQTRVLGSRFLGSALPVLSVEDVDTRLTEERKRYHDATHWCFAFRIGIALSLVERGSDAGEPKGSAGLPILHEIQGRDLTNTLVIVTRYFGGTKLGTGNLARAYADCAAQALAAAQVKRARVFESFFVTCPFDLVSVVYHDAQKLDAQVESVESSSEAAFRVMVSPSAASTLLTSLTNDGRGRISIRPA